MASTPPKVAARRRRTSRIRRGIALGSVTLFVGLFAVTAGSHQATSTSTTAASPSATASSSSSSTPQTSSTSGSTASPVTTSQS